MYANPASLRWVSENRATASSLPPDLLRLDAQKLPREGDACSAGIINLRVGLLFRSRQMLVPEAPIGFDTQTREFVLSGAQQEEIVGRLSGFDETRAHASPLATGGILDAAREPLIEPDYQHWGCGGRPRRDPGTGIIVFDGAGAQAPRDRRPDAIVFHSMEPPGEITLKIEPTTLCNFSCSFCYGRHLDQSSLASEAFYSIVDAMPGLKAVEITGEGEPLLHKDIYNFIAFCRNRGLATHVITNGSALTPRNVAKLIDAGLDALSVSFESLVPERFAHYRPGGDLASVRAGVETLVAAKRHHRKGPRLSMWVTLMRDCLEEVDAFYEFRAEVGFDDGPFFQALNPMDAYARFYPPELRANGIRIDEVRARLRDPATPAGLREALSQIEGTYGGTSCRIFANTVFVDRAARVTPCCLLKAPDFPDFGALTKESFANIWNKPEFRHFRFCLSHGVVLDSCRGCPSMCAPG
jgi:MoaA/NifB/PqqE/SkfB family radical SAM enzyme